MVITPNHNKVKKYIIEFSSYYAIRLYELLKCRDGESKNTKSELEFSVTELRVCFDCEKKYKLFADFKRKVIDIAVREINEKSDIWVRPTYQKTG